MLSKFGRSVNSKVSLLNTNIQQEQNKIPGLVQWKVRIFCKIVDAINKYY